MAARPAPRIDPNACTGALSRLAGPVPGAGADRHRTTALLVEAQRRLKAGDAATAERACREVLGVVPGHPDANNLLSVALGRLGRPAEGEAASRTAIAERPADPGFLLNLGNRLYEQGRFDDAIEVYRRARAAAPAHEGSLNALFAVLAETKRGAEAAAVAQDLIDITTPAPDTIAALAEGLVKAGELRAPLALYRRALDEAPARADWWLRLAQIANKVQRPDDAIEAAERARALEPDNADAWITLAGTLHFKRDFARMAEVLDGMPPDPAQAANAANLRGMMLVAQARIEDGLAAMAANAELAPASPLLQMARIMYLNYDAARTATDLTREHRAFGARFAGAVPPVPAPLARPPEPDRPLRIGYLSPDFRLHSVAYFVAPILEAFDRDRFESVAYAHLARPDQVSEHLRGLASEWRDVTALNDEQLARRIAADGVDILVELAGLTRDSRLLACTGRPAPVQISYLGYPNTTGLPQIDYRITDHIADPEGADDHYTETLIRLPRCFLCYAIPRHAPPIAPPPVRRNHHVTFGSFNNLAKVNREVIRVWAEVLKAVPEARLLLKASGTGDPATQSHLRRRFAEAGVDPARLDFATYAHTPAEHLAVYNDVDIALDTFPYNGTTTTCEALWMGVPVITLVGDRHAGRVGASLLSTIGFTAGLAASAEDYVSTAALLARHPQLLEAARRSLRHDLSRSPLCDMHGHARALEEAYRAVWRIHCNDASSRRSSRHG